MMLLPRPVDFTSTWNDLGDVCFKVLRCQFVPSERWCRSFSDVYALTVSRPISHNSQLYESVTALIQSRISEIANEISFIDDHSLLATYSRHWSVYLQGLETLNNLFMFVNNQYVRSKRPTEADMCYGEVFPSVEKHDMEILQLGLCQWKLFLIDPIQPRLTKCLLHEVSCDRDGIQSQQGLIVPCLESFLRIDELKGITKVNMNVYLQIFEGPLEDESRTYYNDQTSRFLATQSGATFIDEALCLFVDERERIVKYYPQSKSRIANLFTEVVVQQHTDILNRFAPLYIREENKRALSKMYLLLESTSHCDVLVNCFLEHVRETATVTISGIPRDQNLAPSFFVDSMLELRNKFVAFINDVFCGKMEFRNVMDKAFVQSINSSQALLDNGRRAAEYLSRYMDQLLRKTKLCSESELEKKISSSIELLSYIDEKDIFRQFYQKNLCNRLIFGSSTLMDLEESTINQLHALCGYEFTSRFQRMFNDIQLNDDLNSAFQTYLQETSVSYPFGHYCNVLTVSAWPINQKNSAQFTLPRQLHDYLTIFEDFYACKYNGRNLRWIMSHCFVEVRCHFTERAYTLLLSALCAAAVMVFENNDVDEMTVEDMWSALLLVPEKLATAEGSGGGKADKQKDAAEINETDPKEVLQRAMLPLIDAGVLLLKKTPAGSIDAPDATSTPSASEITPGVALFQAGAMVALNKNFANKRAKVKISLIPQTMKTQTVEFEQVQKEVAEDRRYFAQAAVVRIMKSRKTCKHAILVQSVIDLAKGRFNPAVPLIKRCIETLIEKGYLERNPNDPDQYNYLA